MERRRAVGVAEGRICAEGEEEGGGARPAVGGGEMERSLASVGSGVRREGVGADEGGENEKRAAGGGDVERCGGGGKESLGRG